MLTKFITVQRKRLYTLFHSSEAVLLEKYDVLKNYKLNAVKPLYMEFFYRLFHLAPLWFQYPKLRDAMEYKIVEEHFIRTFSLPEQFQFAEYMSIRFKSHILELLDVTPFSWFVLVILDAINYGRIAVIDPLFQEDVCEQFKDDDHHRLLSGIGRVLAGSSAKESNACDQYTLRVIFIYASLLSLYIFWVFYYSNLYMQRHLTSAVYSLIEHSQSRCEQHVPFQPELDDMAEFKETGYFRSLYKVNDVIVMIYGVV